MSEEHLVPVPAIKAERLRETMATRRRRTNMMVMMITVPAMMSSPAVARWPRAQKVGNERDFTEDKWKNGKNSELGSREETSENLFHWR